MKKRKITNEEISSLCLRLGSLFHAGIGTGDAFALMAEDEPFPSWKAQLDVMARRADEGASLSEILRESGLFPDYVSALTEVGERAGRVEEALSSLAAFYENRARLYRRIREALLYPAVLLGVMLAVIVVLLVWVLPIFDDVYAQLGGGLTGIAGALLHFGEALGAALPWIVGVVALVGVIAAVTAADPALRARITGLFGKGDKGIRGRLARARFAQAMAMAVGSGMEPEEALELAVSLSGGETMACRAADCAEALRSGAALSKAMGGAELLPPAECRLLDAAAKSGTTDAMLAKIADRLLEESENALEDLTGHVEPTLVLVTTLMVGLILLSVMLPLMNIMAAIG